MTQSGHGLAHPIVPSRRTRITSTVAPESSFSASLHSACTRGSTPIDGPLPADTNVPSARIAAAPTRKPFTSECLSAARDASRASCRYRERTSSPYQSNPTHLPNKYARSHPGCASIVYVSHPPCWYGQPTFRHGAGCLNVSTANGPTSSYTLR